MEKRILCKEHDHNEVVIKVGVQQPGGFREIFPVENVWNDIVKGRFTFYTFENGRKAIVQARTHSSSGRKYLTTNPDGITENNLDELRSCSV